MPYNDQFPRHKKYENLLSRIVDQHLSHQNWAAFLCSARMKKVRASFYSKHKTTLACLSIIKNLIYILDKTLILKTFYKDGQSLEKNEIFLEVEGPALAILKGQSLICGLASRLCGITQKALLFRKKIEAYKAVLIYPSPATPGLDLLEKKACQLGGCTKLSFFLKENIILTDAHKINGNIMNTISELQESLPPTTKIAFETSCLTELHKAASSGVHVIIMKNMSLSETALAVRTVQNKVALAACGYFDQNQIGPLAQTGVDFIASSALLSPYNWPEIKLKLETRDT